MNFSSNIVANRWNSCRQRHEKTYFRESSSRVGASASATSFVIEETLTFVFQLFTRLVPLLICSLASIIQLTIVTIVENCKYTLQHVGDMATRVRNFLKLTTVSPLVTSWNSRWNETPQLFSTFLPLVSFAKFTSRWYLCPRYYKFSFLFFIQFVSSRFSRRNDIFREIVHVESIFLNFLPFFLLIYSRRIGSTTWNDSDIIQI